MSYTKIFKGENLDEFLPPRLLFFIEKKEIAAKRYVDQILELGNIILVPNSIECGLIDDYCQIIFWNQYDIQEPFETFEDYLLFLQSNIPEDANERNEFIHAIEILKRLIEIKNDAVLKCVGPYNKYPYNNGSFGYGMTQCLFKKKQL